jgi:hypothetical protein
MNSNEGIKLRRTPMDPGRSQLDFNKEQQAGEHVLAADPAVLYRELPTRYHSSSAEEMHRASPN